MAVSGLVSAVSETQNNREVKVYFSCKVQRQTVWGWRRFFLLTVLPPEKDWKEATLP